MTTGCWWSYCRISRYLIKKRRPVAAARATGVGGCVAAGAAGGTPGVRLPPFRAHLAAPSAEARQLATGRSTSIGASVAQEQPNAGTPCVDDRRVSRPDAAGSGDRLPRLWAGQTATGLTCPQPCHCMDRLAPIGAVYGPQSARNVQQHPAPSGLPIKSSRS